MIHITIICVGNLKETYWKDALSEYKKRLSAFCRIDVLELKEYRMAEFNETAIKEALDKEGDAILAVCPHNAVIVALCVEGEAVSSEQLAERLEAYGTKSSEICFIIGSSYGLSPKVKEKATWKWSFSPLTFPHQMMRVVLAEAVYRAFTIIHRIPYHK